MKTYRTAISAIFPLNQKKGYTFRGGAAIA